MTQGAITVDHKLNAITMGGGEIEWMKQNSIRLINGEVPTVLHYAIQSVDEGKMSLVRVIIFTPRFLQVLAGQALEELNDPGEQDEEYTVYNCAYARLMAKYVSALRGTDLPQGYVLRREDAVVLLSNSREIHETINARLIQEGYEVGPGKHAMFLDGGDLHGFFTAPKPEDLASACKMEVLPNVDPLPPPAPGGLESVSASGGGGKTLLWVALGAAAVGGAVYFATKKRR